MHVPDGFLDTTTSVATVAVAAAAVTWAGRRARDDIGMDQGAPMVALVATGIFAAQLINVPVGPGISGHLIGGALATVLVGPARALLSMAAVLVVQAVLFADGGITALGVNITLMGLVAVASAWLVFRAVLAIAPSRGWTVPLAAALGGLFSVPVTAGALSLLFAFGAAAEVPLGPLMQDMLGWHLLIGLGEGLVTGLVVALVRARRADLIHGTKFLGGSTRVVVRERVAA